MTPFQLTLGSYSKISSPSYVAISSVMSQSFLHLLTSHHACALSCFSSVQLSATLWTIAQLASLSMGFSRQEHWNGLLCPSPGDLPYTGIEPASLMSPALTGRFFTISATWEAPQLSLYFVDPEPLHIYDVIPNIFTGKIFSLSFLYRVTLMFNPMIYTLRNKDVMTALRK